jgi:CheY-like chemotaxis protein
MEQKILIVDDESSIRELFSEVLSMEGFAVQTAESAEEALEIVEKTTYWVYFLDLNLPGMNGVELCRQIRKRFPMAIAYAVTGYASLFELSECRDAGFEDYYTKPVNIAELVDAANQAFKKLDRWKKR